jgi:hypothetical protein
LPITAQCLNYSVPDAPQSEYESARSIPENICIGRSLREETALTRYAKVECGTQQRWRERLKLEVQGAGPSGAESAELREAETHPG